MAKPIGKLYNPWYHDYDLVYSECSMIRLANDAREVRLSTAWRFFRLRRDDYRALMSEHIALRASWY